MTRSVLPECSVRVRWQHGAADSAPLYFWHYIIGGSAFQQSETVFNLIEECSRLSQALDDACVDSISRKALCSLLPLHTDRIQPLHLSESQAWQVSKDVAFHAILGESYLKIEAVLKEVAIST